MGLLLLPMALFVHRTMYKGFYCGNNFLALHFYMPGCPCTIQKHSTISLLEQGVTRGPYKHRDLHFLAGILQIYSNVKMHMYQQKLSCISLPLASALCKACMRTMNVKVLDYRHMPPAKLFPKFSYTLSCLLFV